MPQWSCAALLAFACAVLTGCSTPGEREAAASAAAENFANSVRHFDGARACAALAPETRQELEQSAKTSCAKAILDSQLPGAGALQSIEVYGQQARAVLTADTLFLSSFPAGWRITAAGCVPRPHQPYACQVKGG